MASRIVISKVNEEHYFDEGKAYIMEHEYYGGLFPQYYVVGKRGIGKYCYTKNFELLPEGAKTTIHKER